MVTAETAMVLPALVLVLAVAVTAQVTVAARSSCHDAARAGARAAARGEPDGVVRAVVARALSRPARVEVVRGSGLVTVSVTATAGSLVPRIVPLPVEASATAAEEVGG